MRITAVDTFIIDVPQKPPLAPYQSRYVATSRTGALLVRLQTERGLVGWGEAPQLMAFHNRTPYTGREASEFRLKLIGRDATAIESLYAEGLFTDPYLQSAVEMACWDLLGKLCGVAHGLGDDPGVARCAERQKQPDPDAAKADRGRGRARGRCFGRPAEGRAAAEGIVELGQRVRTGAHRKRKRGCRAGNPPRQCAPV